MADSITVVLVGAATATAGYVGNLIIDVIKKQNEINRQRKASIIKLQSYLLASRNVFLAQLKIVKPLCDEIKIKLPHAYKATGYDEILANGFLIENFLSDDQKMRHGLVRSYTINAIRKINMSMIEWLENDSFYKSKNDELGLSLRKLEAHLVLWLAKYEFWIPPRSERALVFLADEKDDGVGFPKGIEELVMHKAGGI